MKLKKSIFYIVTVTVLLALTFGTALADDSVIFRRNISKTPAGETEYASISFMRFAVPAQAADGTLVDLTLTYESGTNEAPVPIYQDTVTVHHHHCETPCRQLHRRRTRRRNAAQWHRNYGRVGHWRI